MLSGGPLRVAAVGGWRRVSGWGEPALRGGARARGVCVLLAALLALALGCAPRAGAYIYWDSGGTISRAGLDGTGVDRDFVTGAAGPVGGPCGVAVDAKHVYWATTRSPSEGFWNTIARANLDGTGVDKEFIVVPSFVPACGLALDSGHIYWSNSRGGIGRANVDGSGINTSFIPAGVTNGPLAVDRAHIYWLYQHDGGCTAIARANLNGSGVDQDFIYPLCSGVDFRGVAVDGAHAYWTSTWSDSVPERHAISRANLDGTGVDEHFINVGRFPTGLAVDRAHVFWRGADRVGDNLVARAIGRANLDGTRRNEDFIAAPTGFGLAIDSLPLSAPSAPSAPESPQATSGNDRIVGTAGNDVLCGLAGADVIFGLAGDDTLFGDACAAKAQLRAVLAAANGGNDSLFGGPGSDRLYGGGGRDRLFGRSGNDALHGGGGNDTLKGQAGRDRLLGDGGADRLSGGSGNDRLWGRGGNDLIEGGKGRDRLSGGPGNDRIRTTDGRRDTVSCGPGRDRVRADKQDRLRGCESIRRRRGRNTLRERPVKGTASGTVTVTLGAPLGITINFTGVASHYGRYSAHIEADGVIIGGEVVGNGTFTLVAANGDQQTGTVEFSGPLPSGDVHATTAVLTITGGTGRFADASGTLTSQNLVTPTCFAEPSCPGLIIETLEGQVTGQISY